VALTGVVMVLSGSDLGPYGPIMIALGLYVLILAFAAEGLLGVFGLIALLRAMRAKRTVHLEALQ
jgi:hypothetical protein